MVLKSEKKRVHTLCRWQYSTEIRCVNRHLLRMWLLLRDSKKLQPSQWLQVDISFCNLLPPPQRNRLNVLSIMDEKKTLLSLSGYLHIALIVIAVCPDQFAQSRNDCKGGRRQVWKVPLWLLPLKKSVNSIIYTSSKRSRKHSVKY